VGRADWASDAGAWIIRPATGAVPREVRVNVRHLERPAEFLNGPIGACPVDRVGELVVRVLRRERAECLAAVSADDSGGQRLQLAESGGVRGCDGDVGERRGKAVCFLPEA